MAKDDQSVAPKERVNITYKPATGDAQEDVELPLKVLVLGDFLGREDETELEERKAIEINKDNFSKVMAEQNLEVEMTVPDRLSEDDENAQLAVKLNPKSIKDFTPDAIVQAVPELKKLMELREALISLKHPLGNNKDFRRKLDAMLKDDASRKQLVDELLKESGGDEAGDEPKGDE